MGRILRRCRKCVSAIGTENRKDSVVVLSVVLKFKYNDYDKKTRTKA